MLCASRRGVAGGIRVPTSQPSDPAAASQPTAQPSDPAAASQPTALVWDFSSSHSTDRIPWPPGQRNASCLFEVAKRVRIELRPDLFIEGDVTLASAARTGDQLEFVSVSFEKQSAEDTRTTALAIARAFEIPRAKIDAWWTAVGEHPGRAQATLAARRGTEPTYDLEIHHSFDDEQPWFISFTLGWSSTAAPPRPGPATAPNR
jgi:hypothetical protein